MQDEALPRIEARVALIRLSDAMQRGSGASELRKELSSFDLFPHEQTEIWARLQTAAGTPQSTLIESPATETASTIPVPLDRQQLFDSWKKRHPERGAQKEMLERIGVDDSDFSKWRRNQKFTDDSKVTQQILKALAM